tara:strand:+ start:68 stop:307 length:240 start_codon:yes stop_codon:yes gene_type:complete
MQKQTLKFTIRQDGRITEEVIGESSSNCVKLTEQIESLIGELENRQYKSEYYLAQPIDNFWKNITTDVTLQHNQNKNQG